MFKIKYTCSNCGRIHYLKYKDTDLCFTCLEPSFYEMEENLLKHREKERLSNVFYSKNYKCKKK